jgi:hypothetical protein
VSSVWPQMISAAIIGIISPVAIMAAIALLASRRPVANVLAFLVGWNLVLIALAVVCQLLFSGVHSATDAGAKAAVDFIIGVLLLAFGLRNLLGAKHPLTPAVAAAKDADPATATGPSWLTEIVKAGPLKSAGFGVITIAASPGNVAVFLAAGQALAGADISTGTRVIWTAILLVFISLAILIPLGIYVAMPRRADDLLGRLRAWLTTHDHELVGWVGLVFGVVLVIKGVAAIH